MWGNLATHLKKLEQSGYIKVAKEFRGKKPLSRIHLSKRGREAFKTYKARLQKVLGNLPQ